MPVDKPTHARQPTRPMSVQDIQALLPHRYPFLLVDRVVLLEPGARAVGWKSVTMNEHFFQGHFPKNPVMPGVLVLEALAQVSALLALRSYSLPEGHTFYLAALDQVRLRRPVVPGDRLELESAVLHRRAVAWKFKCQARVDGAIVAEALMTAMAAKPGE